MTADERLERAALALCDPALKSWDEMVVPQQHEPQQYRRDLRALYIRQARRVLVAFLEDAA